MPGLVEDKVVLVTGAASGIGRASAAALAAEGARVMLSDVDEAEGKQVAADIRAGGGETLFRAADVTDEAQVAALVDATVEAFGRLDAAHNNAGIMGPLGELHDLALEDWHRVLDTNLTGPFLCIKHELRAMRPARAGAIVNTSSVAGVIAAPGIVAYASSKHGLIGLTRTAAVEAAPHGIRVNAILPGSVDTPMLREYMALDPAVEAAVRDQQPAGRIGTPEEIAETVVWLCSDRASYVSGTALGVDGAAVAR